MSGVYINNGNAAKQFTYVTVVGGRRGVSIHRGVNREFSPVIIQNGVEGIMDNVPPCDDVWGCPVVRKFKPLTNP